MVAEVKMPALSPTMEEGKIISWNKKQGDSVAVGDVLLEVETDKAIMEVEAQIKGVFGMALFKDGYTVKVGENIAIILQKGEKIEDIDDYLKNKKNESEQKEKQKEEKNNGYLDDMENGLSKNIANDVIHDEVKTDKQLEEIANEKHEKRIFASPLAKNIAKLNNVDISQIHSGSGVNGRIVKEDIEKFLQSNTYQPNQCKLKRNEIEYVDIKPSNIRMAVAKVLTEQKKEVPHFYVKICPDMTSFVKFRELFNKMAKITNGTPEYKISANDIIALAIAKAIQKNQKMNACWVDGLIRKFNNVDIAVAVKVDDGVITPVIRNADQKNLITISKEIKTLAQKARDGKIQPQEFNGGVITISNLGMFGVNEFTSIIPKMNSCIVAVGAIHFAPAVNQDSKQVEVKQVCNLIFSGDHRVIDGGDLGIFANEVKQLLENPSLLFV
jgi:pyruvate dehydrogenase E2 component (dihydrolipoamide acetyltransferase)